MNNIKQFFSSRTGAYLLLTLAFFLSEEILITNINWDGLNHLSTHLRRLADAALLALPVLFVRTRWFAIPWAVIINIYFISNILYYRYYNAFIPFSSLFLFSNLKGLGGSILAALRWKDILMLCPAVCWIVYYSIISTNKFRVQSSFIAGLALFYIAGLSIPPYCLYDKEANAHPIMRFQHNFNYGIKQYGLIHYAISQFDYLKGIDEGSLSEVGAVVEGICKQDMLITADTSRIEKNLILITMESFGSWLIGCGIDDVEFTPCLNKLIAQEGTLYFPNCLSMVKDGRSSDAQLMMNTGLLPIAHGATAVLCFANQYYSLPKALSQQGYFNSIFVCNDINWSWWKERANYEGYGYDSLLFDFGLDDSLLFEGALPIIKQQKQPFFSNLLNFTMHEPVDIDHPFPLSQTQFSSKSVYYYAKEAHYADLHVGRFLDSLKACGLYDNSIIVITGDHHNITFNEFEGRDQPLLSDTYIPLIILNSPIKPERTDMVIGQIDIYPTLLDLMGEGDYVWRGLGESIFTPGGHSGCAVYHTSEAIGNTSNDSIVAHKRNLWRISDIILRSDYFRKHPIQ